MKYLDFIKRLETMYVHRDQYAYCLGACGELAESQRVQNLFQWYYDHGYKDKIGMPYDAWLSINKGKRCFDCSGMIDFIIFGEGDHRWSSWDFGGMPKQESLAKGVECSILWKRGHVGVDVSHGFYIDCPNWNKELRFGKISEYDWTSSHLCTRIDYTGATDE